MVIVSDRCYYPPSIGNETPDDIFKYDYHDEFTYILKRTVRGTITTRNIAVFVDGACAGNGTSYARAGVGIYFGEDSSYNISGRITNGPPTSQRAEIWAAILALRKVEELARDGDISAKTVVVVSDSKYLVDSMTDWVGRWRINGWRNAKGGSVTNQSDFNTLDSLIETLEDDEGIYVKFWHVNRGQNQDADQLAKASVGY